MTHFLAGLFLGFSLIVAIGAQNAFVLRQGIRREHVLWVAAICTGSDALLIVLGVSSLGAMTAVAPGLAGAVRWAGAAFLIGYGVRAARRALWPTGDSLAGEPVPEAGRPRDATPPDEGRATKASTVATLARPGTAVPVVISCLALTWLNPHVYLDTVFLLGSVAATHGDDRWVFAGGAVVASGGWFFGLAYGARLLGRWLATPRAWRVVDAGIAVVMLVLGVALVWPT